MKNTDTYPIVDPNDPELAEIRKDLADVPRSVARTALVRLAWRAGTDGLPVPPVNEEHDDATALTMLRQALRIDIARATHEMNRLYCSLLGDDSQPSWEDAPDWQRESALAGVRAVLDGTAQSPEDQHNEWMAHKSRDGWAYGPRKDPEAKTHPCMVPYSDLPPEQRAKDSIFRAVVEGLRERKMIASDSK